MSDRERCFRCGRSLGLVPDDEIETARESIGFGLANDRTRSFCGTRCRCLWAGLDPVIDETNQATLAGYADSGRPDGHDPDAIAWGR